VAAKIVLLDNTMALLQVKHRVKHVWLESIVLV
jgi:hypothetical protein